MESAQRSVSPHFADRLSRVLGVSAPWLRGHTVTTPRHPDPEEPIIIEHVLRSDRANQWKTCLIEMITDCFEPEGYSEEAGCEILDTIERHLPVRASRRYRTPDDVPVETKAPAKRRSP